MVAGDGVLLAKVALYKADLALSTLQAPVEASAANTASRAMWRCFSDFVRTNAELCGECERCKRSELACFDTSIFHALALGRVTPSTRSQSVPGSLLMASDDDAASPSTVRDLLVDLPNGEYRYKHAEAPARNLPYDDLAQVVDAARSLNFYERVRPWDDLRRIMKRRDVATVQVDDQAMNDLDALRASCAKLQRRISRFGKAQLDALPKGEVHVKALRTYVAPDCSRLA